ncbi:MAG: hypothetical protein ACYS0C_06350 [Planctomycetota bacterium]|jgi:DUF2075 family protein
MKERIEEITGLLGRTEAELREMIADAAKAGDYRTVDLAKTAAVGIQSLQTRITNPGGKVQAKAVSSGGKPKGKSASRRGGKARYPRFDVKKNSLIRIGWSKKERREYTHKAPKAVYDQTVRAMADLARSAAGPFMAEQIIEHLNQMGSETIPSYQVYVVIGLLRRANCIKQRGREGYDVPTDIAPRAEREWEGMLRNKK